jgi:hypothetical protein
MAPGLPHSTQHGAPSETRRDGQSFEELEVVYTLVPYPNLGIARGEHGTIVHTLKDERAYFVEFVDDDGTTRAEADFTADQISRTPPGPEA